MSEIGQSLVVKTPIGAVQFITDSHQVIGVDLYCGVDEFSNAHSQSTLFRAIQRQVDEYFALKRQAFELPLQLSGTSFQQRVCRALLEIPYGTCVTYGELAQQLKSSARAVGGACRRNPIPLIIPCHRVVAANGPGGFSGATAGAKMDVKMALLQLESDGVNG